MQGTEELVPAVFSHSRNEWLNELRRSALSRFLGKRLCVTVANTVANRSEERVKHRYVKRFRVLKCLFFSKSNDRCLSYSKRNDWCSEMNTSISEGLGGECHAMKSILSVFNFTQIIFIPSNNIIFSPH